VLVGGEAGIGKTSLVTELARRADEQGWLVLTGHCIDLAAAETRPSICDGVLPGLRTWAVRSERRDLVVGTAGRRWRCCRRRWWL
jgi:hypothetical protein